MVPSLTLRKYEVRFAFSDPQEIPHENPERSVVSLSTLFKSLQAPIDFDVRIRLDQPINDL